MCKQAAHGNMLVGARSRSLLGMLKCPHIAQELTAHKKTVQRMGKKSKVGFVADCSCPVRFCQFEC